MNELIQQSIVYKKALVQVARVNFWAFCCLMDWEFYHEHRRFLKEPAIALNKVAYGKLRHIYLAMPPRSGKSYLVSLFSAWYIGFKPEVSVMRNTNTMKLYNKFSYDIREMLRMPMYKLIFPEISLSRDHASISSWRVQGAKQESYFGGGVGGNIIGFGASIGITDDLYRGHMDALSPTYSDNIQLWYDSTMRSRLEKGAPRIEIGTRWSVNDVMGKNLAEQKYDYVYIQPALIAGGTFCEAVLSTDEYLDIMNSIDSYLWESQYMQQPIEVEGLAFARDELKFTPTPILQEGFNICFIDTADEGDDYYCAVFGYVLEGSVFIYDVYLNKFDLTINDELVVTRIKNNKCNYVVVETNNFGVIHKRNLEKALKGVTVYGKWQKANKHLRILSQSGYIKQNFYFDSNATDDEYVLFMHYLTTYIKLDKSGQKDDCPDALAGLCEHLTVTLGLI